MRAMLIALTRAFFSLLHWRMLVLMVWPVAVSVLVWGILAGLFWGRVAAWLNDYFQASDLVQWMMQYAVLAFIAAHVSTIVLALAFIPLVLVTAVLILGIFAMPAMVKHVERNYPDVERRRGGSFAGSVWNSLAALLVFIALAVLTLPLWVLPFLWPVLPVLLFAYLNQRVFRYDALAEHADAEEIRLIVRRHRGELFGLGIAVSLLGHVPLLGFFAPVYGGLVFIHYALWRLGELRSGTPRYLG
jgi:CysZ protein